MALSDIRVVQDQARQPYIFQWTSTDQVSGVLSLYCPLGINKYLYEQSNENYYYFLQGGYFGDKQELNYIIFMEILFDQRLIVFHVQVQIEGKWVECTFQFQPLEIEGVRISTVIYYEDSGQVFVEQFWGKSNRTTFTFPNTIKPNFIVTQISGGIYSDINPMTGNKILLKQFPGKMNAAIILKQEFRFLWSGYPSYQGSYAFLLQEQIIDLKEGVSNSFYSISTQTQKDYRVSFWAKAQALYDNNFDQIIHMLRVVANRFTSDFMATGSNSFILDYVYDKQTHKWIFRIQFYSQIIPVPVRSIPDNSLLIITKEILIDNYSYINTWHFIFIDYSNNVISFQFENPQFNYKITQKYENVYQYQLIYYRLFFGGTIIETNSLARSFALISFQDHTKSITKCHQQCQTCFGPFSNNCLSCPPNSNRVYEPRESTCQCQLWYKEFDNHICKLFSNDSIKIKLEENTEKEDFRKHCNFGDFEYNENCYKCPSASQNNQIICSACLMRPTDWIYNNPACYDVYYPYENNPNYQYVQMKTDQELANQYYIFENQELQPCYGCKLCQDKLDSTCQLSSYFHLDKETYIQCLKGYYFSNGKCQKTKQNLDIIKISCKNNCLKCSDGQCQLCQNNINFFLNYMGQCQLCSISNCKYCFQYNSQNLNENSILRNGFQKTVLSDDFEVGCAQCLKGYVYSFRLKQCLPQYNEIDCQSYINDQDELQCYSTQFDQLITKFQQIQNCQEQLPNCEQCIYTKFSILVCIKCSQGFYINSVNGLCNKCADYQASDCQLVDQYHGSQKLLLYGFLQHYTQTLNDLSILFKDFNNIDTLECNQNFLLDTFQNQCIDQCINCDNCAIINGQQQCLKCTLTSGQSSFYSQNNGKCYQCPLFCKFCLELDLDLISVIFLHKLVIQSLLFSYRLKQKIGYEMSDQF
ncbi:unnamed protein product [Paramecium octaurelia]|uniref:Uncharacterized protein n=1 Tax=Paramecium octaurelia TaxID=43137 RepID=A0A8S1UAB1_PAROT|nr:unnamed protein product [Paramecium octaurelia]